MIRIALLIFILLISNLANSQSTKYWRKTIGMPGPTSWDDAASIKQLNSGEYLVACNKGGIGIVRPSILKLNQFGNIISQMNFNDIQ